MSKQKTPAPDPNETGTLTIADLESGWLVSALKKLHNLSRSYYDRLALAKLTRKLERATEEPFRERQDLIIAFGTEDEVTGADGRKHVTKNVNRVKMTPVEAKAFDSKLKAIQSIPVITNGITLPVPIKLRKNEMLELNADEMQAILGVVEIAEDKSDPEKDWQKEAERLEKELAEEKKKVAAVFEKLTEVARTGK